jgi:hypothetical protein
MAASSPQMPDQLRESGVWNEGCPTACPGPSLLTAAGGLGRGGRHCQVEHAQADRYGEKPSVQLAGNPVEADQLLFHRQPHAPSIGPSLGSHKHTPVMLRCNIKTGKRLLKYALIVFAPQRWAGGSGLPTGTGIGFPAAAPHDLAQSLTRSANRSAVVALLCDGSTCIGPRISWRAHEKAAGKRQPTAGFVPEL